jgi:hypothetical protein
MSEAETVSDVETARDLTAFQQNVLLVLAEESRYGLAIKRELEDYYDEEVNHGRLYPNLDTLIERGLVEKSELDKRTNEYAVTSSSTRSNGASRSSSPTMSAKRSFGPCSNSRAPP